MDDITVVMEYNGDSKAVAELICDVFFFWDIYISIPKLSMLATFLSIPIVGLRSQHRNVGSWRLIRKVTVGPTLVGIY